MSKATSAEIKAALKKAAQWGSAVACGAGDGLLLLSHGIKKTRKYEVDDSLGQGFSGYADPSEVSVSGDLQCYLRYDGLDLPLALAMGATGGAPVQQGGTAAYAQSLMLADTVEGLFGTFALNNQVNVDEYTSMKVAGFTIKGRVGRPVEVAFHCIANDRKTGSLVNTSASFVSVTLLESANRVLMGQLEARMNDAASGALGSGDRLYPSSFELTFKRALEGRYGASSTLDTIDEPTTAGMPSIALKLEFPRYGSKSHFEAWDASTPKKLELIFTGALLEGAYARSFKLSFPNLAYSSVELPIEKGIFRLPMEFACLSAKAAPSGMSGITRPFQINIVNTRSTDVLA